MHKSQISNQNYRVKTPFFSWWNYWAFCAFCNNFENTWRIKSYSECKCISLNYTKSIIVLGCLPTSHGSLPLLIVSYGSRHNWIRWSYTIIDCLLLLKIFNKITSTSSHPIHPDLRGSPSHKDFSHLNVTWNLFLCLQSSYHISWSDPIIVFKLIDSFVIEIEDADNIYGVIGVNDDDNSIDYGVIALAALCVSTNLFISQGTGRAPTPAKRDFASNMALTSVDQSSLVVLHLRQKRNFHFLCLCSAIQNLSANKPSKKKNHKKLGKGDSSW